MDHWHNCFKFNNIPIYAKGSQKLYFTCNIDCRIQMAGSSLLVNLFDLKVLRIFKNIFETLHDLNDRDEKTKMLKPPF